MFVPPPRDAGHQLAAEPADRAADGPTIRRARAADAERLARFMERTFRDTYADNSDATALEQYVAEHFAPAIQAAELADPGLATLVMEREGALVAFAQLRHASHDDAPACVAALAHVRAPAELARFYVDRRWHGRGLAPALMRACLDAAVPADALWLLVYRINARAIAFYARCGFRHVGTAPFRFGDEIHDDVVMMRSLVADGGAGGSAAGPGIATSGFSGA